MRISDWSSDVCSSDLFKVDFGIIGISGIDDDGTLLDFDYREVRAAQAIIKNSRRVFLATDHTKFGRNAMVRLAHVNEIHAVFTDRVPPKPMIDILAAAERSEEHTSELQSLMRISYAVFCLKKKKTAT